MKIFSKIYLGILTLAMLLWAMPWAINFALSRPGRSPFVMYSPLIRDFILYSHDETNGLKRHDTQGNTYTEAQADSLLPTFYVRQLVTDGRWPDTLLGRHITPHEVQRTNFSFRSTAADVNAIGVELYMLQEAMSGRVEMELPTDVLRFTPNGLEFIDMASNTVDAEKSQRFTETLKAKGFAFPPRHIASNPSTRKDYDNGMLLLDAQNQLFHLKQLRGRPYARHVELPEGLEPRQLFVTEFRDRQLLGLLCDAENTLWALRANDYTLHRTGITRFDPQRDNISIVGNMFDWTVRISTPQTERWLAIDATSLQLIDTLTISPNRGFHMPGLCFGSPTSPHLRPRWR